MSRAIIRFARRLANWEENLPIDELQDREFKARNGGPDLRPSVYEVDDLGRQVVRTYAEHAHRIDPPATALALDVVNAVPRTPATTPGETSFQFTRDQHREVLLRDRDELLAFIRDAITAPRQKVQKRAVYDYVRGQMNVGDEEWAAVANSPNAKPWVQKLAAER